MFRFLRKSEPKAHTSITPLRSAEELDHALLRSESAPVLLFKHSAICGVSFFARREVLELTQDEDPAVYELVVQDSRSLSNCVAEMFGIRHASPQAILVSSRQAIWNASHGAITSNAVREAAASA